MVLCLCMYPSSHTHHNCMQLCVEKNKINKEEEKEENQNLLPRPTCGVPGLDNKTGSWQVRICFRSLPLAFGEIDKRRFREMMLCSQSRCKTKGGLINLESVFLFIVTEYCHRLYFIDTQHNIDTVVSGL